jgi:perosamine synthetase
MSTIAFSRPFFGAEEEEACVRVIRSRWVVGGQEQLRFEQRVASRCEAPHAVAVSSWTTGGFLILRAWGIGAGDEVIVPSLTFIASVNVIRHVGATPVFVDVDPRTWNLDPTDVEAKVSARTKAIIAVDQIGLPAELDRITEIARRRGIKILQDAACSFGSRFKGRPVGSYCEVACFSLHARKVVTTGEGGVIVCRDEDFAARLRRLRHQGMSLSDHERDGMNPTRFETYPEIGYNARFTDIQAAVGNAQLDRLEEILGRRRAVAARYFEALRAHPLVTLPYVPREAEPNWQSFQVAMKPDSPLTRDALMSRLFERGIPTRRGVMASHLEPPYAGTSASLPRTEHAAASCLQLPMHPELTREQQDRVIAALASTAEEAGRRQ